MNTPINAPQTKALLHKRNTPFTWFILAAAAYLFLPSLLLSTFWINLKSVEVVASSYGEPIQLQVDRVIHNPFKGEFTVSIRDDSGDLICLGRSADSFNYYKDNSLPLPMYLSWWMGGDDRIDHCASNGFINGHFYVDTCHTMIITVFDIPFARRCVRSNKFMLTTTEEGQMVTPDEVN